MADQNEVDLDSVIDRLLEVRGSRPGKQVQLLEAEIRYLCTKAREIFISQPILLELEAPIKVHTSPVNTHEAGNWKLTLLSLDLWRYSRPILRSPAPFRVWRLPARSELPLPRRLRRSRQAVARDYLPALGVQDQVSRKLLHPAWKPRVCLYQPHLRFLRRVQTPIQHQAMEDIYGLLQLLAHRCNH